MGPAWCPAPPRGPAPHGGHHHPRPTKLVRGLADRDDVRSSRGAPRSTTPPTCPPPRSPSCGTGTRAPASAARELYGEIRRRPGAPRRSPRSTPAAPRPPRCTAWPGSSPPSTRPSPPATTPTSPVSSPPAPPITAGARRGPARARRPRVRARRRLRCGPPRRVVPHRGRRLRPVGGDRIVGEVNNGGDLIETVLHRRPRRPLPQGHRHPAGAGRTDRRASTSRAACTTSAPHRPRGPAVQLDT